MAGGLPECQLLSNVKIDQWDEPVRYRCKLTKGWLVPLTETPITLRFKALGRSDASYLALTPRGGKTSERWLISGQSIDVALQPGTGPWQLDVFGDVSSVTEMEIQASVPVPLFYGNQLEQIEAIQQHLRGLTANPTPEVR